MRINRHLPLSAASFTAVTLLLAGCGSDVPTSTDGSGSGTIPKFVVTPEATTAGKTSYHQLIRTLPTVDKRTVPGAARAQGGGDGGDINSPFDLTYFGGPVVTNARNWNIYVNCASTPAGCWGTGNLSPANFLRDLNRSSFIHIADQYIGNSAGFHFPTSELSLDLPLSGDSATINDIFSIVFSAAAFTGQSGYTNIYHVFLPQGTDMCITDGLCYSPDIPDSWVFCAFHGSVDFSATLHVLYSVEPYQGVDGCELPGKTPHGVIDATSSTLSHEFFETITDPDLNAWFNSLFGEEVADLCSGFANNERMGHSYVIQSEYSNDEHACTGSI
jgi:hypothetical protein